MSPKEAIEYGIVSRIIESYKDRLSSSLQLLIHPHHVAQADPVVFHDGGIAARRREEIALDAQQTKAGLLIVGKLSDAGVRGADDGAPHAAPTQVPRSPLRACDGRCRDSAARVSTATAFNSTLSCSAGTVSTIPTATSAVPDECVQLAAVACKNVPVRAIHPQVTTAARNARAPRLAAR